MAFQIYTPILSRKVREPFITIDKSGRGALSLSAVEKYVGSFTGAILRYDVDNYVVAFEFVSEESGNIAPIRKQGAIWAVSLRGLISQAGWNKDHCVGRHYIHDADDTSEYPYIRISEKGAQ